MIINNFLNIMIMVNLTTIHTDHLALDVTKDIYIVVSEYIGLYNGKT